MCSSRIKHRNYSRNDNECNQSNHIVKVSRPVCPVIRVRDQFFFLPEICLRQLRVCYFAAPSLTKGRVFNLLLLLGVSSAVPLGSESLGTQDQILLSQFFRLPQPGEPSLSLYIRQEQSGPVIPTGTGLVTVYNSRALRYAHMHITTIHFWWGRYSLHVIKPAVLLKAGKD
jgi:hypothetical protein